MGTFLTKIPKLQEKSIPGGGLKLKFVSASWQKMGFRSKFDPFSVKIWSKLRFFWPFNVNFSDILGVVKLLICSDITC